MSEVTSALDSVVKERLLPYLLPSSSYSQSCSNTEHISNEELKLEFSLAVMRAKNSTINVDNESINSSNHIEYRRAITVELVECKESSSCIIAVLVNKKLIQEEFDFYVREFANSSELQYDRALYCNNNMEHEQSCKLFSALLLLPILTTSLVESLNDDWLTKLCLLFPAHQQLWNERKRLIVTVLHNIQISEVMSCKCINTTIHFEELNETFLFILRKLLHECVLCDLLLSVSHKESAIWTHRRWIVEQIVSYWHQLNSVMPNDTDNSIYKSKYKEMETCFWHYFVTYDNKTCHNAADAHLMNYSVWLYKRLRYRLLMSMKEQSEQEEEEEEELEWLIENELLSTFNFAQVHLRDSSALSYLLFVLHEHVNASHRIREIINNWWRKLFAWTQFAIRYYANYGYESLWMLRCGLVVFACKETNELICSDWLLEDELSWVTTFVDGYDECENEKCDILNSISVVDISSSPEFTEMKNDYHHHHHYQRHDNKSALSEVQQTSMRNSTSDTTSKFTTTDIKKNTDYNNDAQYLSLIIQQKSVENGGSIRWNQYYAARYGLQLLSLL